MRFILRFFAALHESAIGTSRRCPTVGFQTIAAMRRERRAE
jgi:hypothetical protein